MNFLKKILPKIYIVLIPTGNATVVFAQLRQKEKILKQFDVKRFESISALTQYVQKLERESSLSYTTLLACEPRQGLLSSCTAQEGLDMSTIEKVCYENSWGIYIDKDDLFELQKQYLGVGLDLLFSPYTLLASVHKEHLKKTQGLYLLITPQYMVAMVFKERTAHFAERLKSESWLEHEDADTISEYYMKQIEQLVEQFYKHSSKKTMFIESVVIADAVGLDADFEHALEERLFVEVSKERLVLEDAVISLVKEELGCH